MLYRREKSHAPAGIWTLIPRQSILQPCHYMDWPIPAPYEVQQSTKVNDLLKIIIFPMIWPLGRPRHRWEDNIKMDLQEVGWGCGDWMELAQDRDRWRALVSMVMNLQVPKMPRISWLAAEPVSFSRRTLLHGISKYDMAAAAAYFDMMSEL